MRRFRKSTPMRYGTHVSPLPRCRLRWSGVVELSIHKMAFCSRHAVSSGGYVRP